MVASYYTQITLPRLTELLDLSAAEAERTLCRLVTDKVVRAKIDRPAGIVDFSPRSNPDEILNAWSGDLGKMLGLIEKTSHLINKASLSDLRDHRIVILTSACVTTGVRNSRCPICYGEPIKPGDCILKAHTMTTI